MDVLRLAAEQKNIAMVVTDVVMPHVSDGELARQLARLRSNLKFLLVSGYAGKTILGHKVADLEMNFRQKPYTRKQLSWKIRTALDAEGGAGKP